MYNRSYVTDLLTAAKLAAIAENDEFLIYLIEMAISRAKSADQSVALKTA